MVHFFNTTIATLVLSSVLLGSAKVGAAETAAAATTALPSTVPLGLIQIPAQSQYYSPYAFVVDKKARTLNVWHQTGTGLQKVAEFPADLGKNQGPKIHVGDHKTPEGIYFLQTMIEGRNLDFSQYGKRAYTTDYPNHFDKIDGKTGYGIWLHAIPDTVPLTRGSRGCVVVRNEVIVGLDKYIRLGRTPLLILDKMEMLPQEEMNRMNAAISQWLESWRVAWEKKDLDTYITSYDEKFKAMKMNRDQWKSFKAGLNEKYKQITVKLSRPVIFADRDRAVVRFLQEYTSDQHTDFGEKVLYLRKHGENYKIIGEVWAPETSQIAREEIESTTRAAMPNALSSAVGN